MRRAARSALASTALLAAAGVAAEATDPPADGAALYTRNACADCHESGKARPLADLSQRYSVGSLADILRNSPPGMPVLDLSDAERRALAEHLLVTFP